MKLKVLKECDVYKNETETPTICCANTLTHRRWHLTAPHKRSATKCCHWRHWRGEYIQHCRRRRSNLNGTKNAFGFIFIVDVLSTLTRIFISFWSLHFQWFLIHSIDDNLSKHIYLVGDLQWKAINCAKWSDRRSEKLVQLGRTVGLVDRAWIRRRLA